MHRARIVYELQTQMGEDEVERWAQELRTEAAAHLVEGETITLDWSEIEGGTKLLKNL